MSALFTAVTLGPRTAPNRIAVSPMCQYSAIGGMPTDWHLQNTMTHAMSGAGLVMMEATAVEERGRITLGASGSTAIRQRLSKSPVPTHMLEPRLGSGPDTRWRTPHSISEGTPQAPHGMLFEKGALFTRRRHGLRRGAWGTPLSGGTASWMSDRSALP